MLMPNESNRASRTKELDNEDAMKTVRVFPVCKGEAVLKESNVRRV
jgi:hypothetical protein